MQERRRVDLADEARAVDQEHLEHVRELAPRPAARPVDGDADVLAEALDEGHELARPSAWSGSTSGSPPASPLARLPAYARITAGESRAGSNDSVTSRTLSCSAGRGGDRLLERVEHAVGERAALGVDAGRVDEAEQRDPLAREARQLLRAAVDAQDPPSGAAMMRWSV